MKHFKSFIEFFYSFCEFSNFLFSLQFGVSIIASLLDQAENILGEKHQSEEWSNFIVSLSDAIGSSPPIVAPCQPIAANTLNEHLTRISSLGIERYAPIELLLTDANPSR